MPPLWAYRDAAEACTQLPKHAVAGRLAQRRGLVGQVSAEEKNPHLNDKPEIIMIKRILILALAIGFIAESSVFAADPTPAPSPAKGAVTESASPSPSPAKTHRRQRVEARRKGRQTRREARKGEATPTPEAKATPTPKQ